LFNGDEDKCAMRLDILGHHLKRFMGYAGCPGECKHVYKIKLTTFGIAKGYVYICKKKILLCGKSP